MEVWRHDGQAYELISMYSVAGDAQMWELRGPTGSPDAFHLSAEIPDATPGDDAFTPRPAGEVTFHCGGSGAVPWPLLRRFVDHVEASGDIVGG